MYTRHTHAHLGSLEMSLFSRFLASRRYFECVTYTNRKNEGMDRNKEQFLNGAKVEREGAEYIHAGCGREPEGDRMS